MTHQLERDFEARPARTFLKVGIIFIIIISIFGLVAGAIGLITLPFRATRGVVERTFQPDAMIGNYEWFKRQVQDVKAMDARLAASRNAKVSFEESAGGREKWSFEDKQEWGRLNSIILGLENQRAGMVAEYNARSEMANRSLFKTADLPETLQ